LPNTLAHIGIQGLATRTVLRGADFKWIYIGCILPDLSWILQRFVRLSLSGIDPYDMRLYATVQTSFFFCILISAALALLTSDFRRTFSILVLNSFLHLLLDALQIKWGNGVHFLAPFDWRMINFGFFWPESLTAYLLTLLGLIYIIWNWHRSLNVPADKVRRSTTRLIAPIVLIAIYAVLPLAMFDGPEEADNHYVKTLRAYQDRPGRDIEVDREFFTPTSGGGVLRTYAGEDLLLEGIDLDRPVPISIRGNFISENRVRVRDYHIHSDRFREIASYIGLFLILILWFEAVRRRSSKTRP